MDEEITIDLEQIEIAPLKRDFLDMFSATNEGDEFIHLVEWFQTIAIPAQDERKVKVYVAVHEEKVIGYMAISWVFSEVDVPGLLNSIRYKPHMLLLGKLYICPEFRSFGIGRKLLEFMNDLAQKVDEMIGCTGIIVDADNNSRTINFYKNFGFEEINTKKDTVTMFFKIPEAPVLMAESVS